jgi:hypothetical protein
MGNPARGRAIRWQEVDRIIAALRVSSRLFVAETSGRPLGTITRIAVAHKIRDVG